jgi:uncharacterized protein DUF1501/TAT (twin-arginine translocation) pathway-exported protein
MQPRQPDRSLSRRQFLRAGAAGAAVAGLTLSGSDTAHANSGRDVDLILLFLVGGPSQLDTWDMKPNAPAEVRGPFKPIATNVPGVQICEHFPRMAQIANRYAIVRSVHHNAAPIHETGHQLMQTGRLFRFGQEHPHYGAVMSHVKGQKRNGMPPFVLLPGMLGNTGVTISHGQGAGALGAEHAPTATFTSSPLHTALDLDRELPPLRSRYGSHDFGRACLQARRLVEAGVRCVTVNMFETVFDRVTWDCHADSGSLASSLNDYRRTLCPMFDEAYTALLDDLADRGLLASTLVVAMGEFGRTPYLNSRGGRDHWPGVWSILMAGGGIRGGQVIGSSDALAAEPRDRPVAPAEIAATIYHRLGIDLQTRLPGPEGQPCRLVDANPIAELS